ncbi:unnamed protein product [Sphenostylis stenocarpa]|uniref:Uncharacterized protein n=1 Tax=Sphenostylis stenocarpa TaxID=92480 RepID=A0AA86SJT5_9FABA|nr:unnamed protein product [Sphenostylis stenocarpa]
MGDSEVGPAETIICENGKDIIKLRKAKEGVKSVFCFLPFMLSILLDEWHDLTFNKLRNNRKMVERSKQMRTWERKEGTFEERVRKTKEQKKDGVEGNVLKQVLKTLPRSKDKGSS